MEYRFRHGGILVVIDNFIHNSCRVQQFKAEDLIWQDSFTMQPDGMYICKNTINEELRLKIVKAIKECKQFSTPISLQNNVKVYYAGKNEHTYEYLLQGGKPLSSLEPTDIIEEFLFNAIIPGKIQDVQLIIYRLPNNLWIQNNDYPPDEEEILKELRNKLHELKW